MVEGNIIPLVNRSNEQIFPITSAKGVIFGETGERLDVKLEQLMKKIANKNILDNSNFINPVNQKGIVTLNDSSEDQHIIDRWLLTGSASVTDSGIKLKASSEIVQFIYDKGLLDENKKYTISLALDSGEIYSGTIDPKNTSSGGSIYLKDKDIYAWLNIYNPPVTNPQKYGRVKIGCFNTDYTIKWVKLEEGDIATEYIPKSYSEELNNCYRYLVVYDTKYNSYTTIIGAGTGSTSTSVQMVVSLPCEMISLPKVTYSGTITLSDGTNAPNVTKLGTDANSPVRISGNNVFFYVNSSGITANRFYQLRLTLDSKLIISCEF